MDTALPKKLYYYRTNEETFSPVSKEVIDALAADGKLPFSTTRVRKEDSQNWIPLSTLLQREIKFKEVQSSKKQQPFICILFYASAWVCLLLGIGITLEYRLDLRLVILYPCILVFMGKLLCYAHMLVEKCRINGAQDKE